MHPQLKNFLEEYSLELKGRNPHLFPGRHGLGHIHKGSADRILREALRRVDLDEQGISTHSFRRRVMREFLYVIFNTISGHRSLAALERYLGVTEQQKENAISTLVF